MAFTTATTLAILSVASTLTAAGVSAYGAKKAGDAQEAAGQENARNLRQTAKAREAEMHENIARQHREARRRLATTRATMAGTGTQLNDGSNKDVLGVVTNRLETGIADDARRQQMEIRALNQQASLTQWEGSQAAAAGNLQAAGTVLGGVASAAGSAYDFNRKGAL